MRYSAGNCLASRAVTERKISAAALAQDVDYHSRSFGIASATHYHPEMEVRESPEETKVICNYPEGIGREVGKKGEINKSDNPEYYIKDYLGNVRLTIAYLEGAHIVRLVQSSCIPSFLEACSAETDARTIPRASGIAPKAIVRTET